MKKPNCRVATAEDIKLFWNDDDDIPTMHARVGLIDGEIAGIGGIHKSKDNRWVAFFDLTDIGRPYKFTIFREIKKVFKWADDRGIIFIYADRDMEEMSSKRLLQALGFEKQGLLYKRISPKWRH